jgi:hypothetical protein
VAAGGGDEDDENIDPTNFKGIYFGDGQQTKYTCPDTGAHFEFTDMNKRLNKAKEWRKKLDIELGLEQSPMRDRIANAKAQISSDMSRKIGP